MENKHDENHMDTDTQDVDVDQTRHKSTYTGTPIKQADSPINESSTGYDSEPIHMLHDPPPPLKEFVRDNSGPFKQFVRGNSNSAPESPVVLEQQEADSLTLPTARKANVFQNMMEAKQSHQPKYKGKKTKKGPRGGVDIILKPIPGITKLKSPIANVVATDKPTQGSPKRNRDTMEGKIEDKQNDSTQQAIETTE
jgi:hypothetical protein